MRFYSSYVNRRRRSYGSGILAGNAVHTRGWNAGVSVTPEGEAGEPDVFTIEMTTGSHAAGASVTLGTVTDTSRGPVFRPSERLAAAILHFGELTTESSADREQRLREWL